MNYDKYFYSWSSRFVNRYFLTFTSKFLLWLGFFQVNNSFHGDDR